MGKELALFKEEIAPSFGLAPLHMTWADKVSWVMGYFLSKGPALGVVPLVTHEMTEDSYIRSLYVPTGTLVFGRTHLTGHTLYLDKGEDLIFTPNGIIHRVAPWKTVTTPGFQMVRYTLTDTVSRAVLHNPDNLSREELERRCVKDEGLQLSDAREIYARHKLLEHSGNTNTCHLSHSP